MKRRLIVLWVMLMMCLLPMTASANSSWRWLSEARPYDVLPFVAVITITIETAALWYVLGYAAERVAVEGLRTDSLMTGGIRVSQLLSALLLFAAALIIILRSDNIRSLKLLLPGALLLAIILTGTNIGFFGVAALAVLQMLFSLYTYITIRKKATKP